ncbi:MAG: response regulator [Acidobacteria bacterium]|nr:MAG: response regulator [Acidobacteriota bacterium]
MTVAATFSSRQFGEMPQAPAVLVVEDEPSVQTTFCATLTLMGFKTHHAATVDRALEILGSERIDAASLDVRLPDPTGLDRSGLTLLAYLRSTTKHAHLPVLIFTGVPLSAEEESLIQKHNAEVFYKPQRYVTLVECLTRMLASSTT